MKGLLNIKNTVIGYKSKTVAKNINLQLNPGELCAVVGINGIGKSTLLRTIAKLQPKLDGAIAIEEKDIEHFSPLDFAQKLSVVLTESITSKNLTVVELIALGRQPHTNWLGQLQKQDKAIIKKSIQQFGLEELANKKCHELSDGQLQRVLIARAMAQDTPIIILDEPTTHLDLFHKVQILKLLQRLAHEYQKTILFSTHEINLALELSDKILILDGETNPFGTPEDLIKSNYFNRLFPSNIIEFDTTGKAFRVKREL